MKLTINACTLCGPMRRINQDALLVNGTIVTDGDFVSDWDGLSASSNALAVADGMGGHLGGEVASRMVLAHLNQFCQQLEQQQESSLIGTLSLWAGNTHQTLRQYGKDNPEFSGLGTTLTALLFFQEHIFLVHAGDTKLFRLRNGFLVKLTRDHSLAEMTGDPSVPKNIIINAFGAGERMLPDVENLSKKIIPGDTLLLCSDGLTDGIAEEELESYMNQQIQITSHALVQKAIEMGSSDNASAILIQIS